MTFYVYEPANREFLADGEKRWTEDIFAAVSFTTRELAGDIAERELGPGHGAYVLDDGVEEGVWGAVEQRTDLRIFGWTVKRPQFVKSD